MISPLEDQRLANFRSLMLVVSPIGAIYLFGVDGDTKLVSCQPWGSTESAEDGCVWTPTYPSVSKVTGTADQRYHGTVTIIWQVSWVATNGASGALGELRTTTPVEMGVQEIQTIGG